MKLKHTVAATAVLAAMSMSAQGSALYDSLIDNVTNFYEDQNRESVFDMDNSGGVSSGDVFVGFVRIDDRSIPTGDPQLAPNELYGLFSIEVDTIESETDGTETEYFINYKPTTVTGLTLSDLGVGNVDSSSLVGVYGDVGANYITTAPTDQDSDGKITILDFALAISSTTQDLTTGLEEGVDHWVSEATVGANPLLDPIANLALTESLTLVGGVPGNGTIGFHSGMGITYASMGDEDCGGGSPWCFARLVEDDVENPLDPSLHELTVQNGDISGASDLLYSGSNPFFSGAAADGTGLLDINGVGINYYGLSSNADFGIFPQHIPEPSTLALMGLGMVGMGIARRRRSKAA